MTTKTGRSKNTYDDVNAPLGIALNTTTYTQLLPAKLGRIQYKVSNTSNNEVVIKEQTAGVPDNLIRGFSLFKKSVYVSETDSLPIGEISAIAITGTPTVLVVEA